MRGKLGAELIQWYNPRKVSRQGGREAPDGGGLGGKLCRSARCYY
jgi:hypothetical protein